MPSVAAPAAPGVITGSRGRKRPGTHEAGFHAYASKRAGSSSRLCASARSGIANAILSPQIAKRFGGQENMTTERVIIHSSPLGFWGLLGFASVAQD
eukprot:4526983-Pyramimonas_sp.AAC.1